MDEFYQLNAIIKQLLSPGGCPWDQEQTLQSMRSSLLEETYEVIEAIDLDNTEAIKEELGDLFFNVVFLCHLGKKFNRFEINEVLEKISEKLIRRHPHVFGEVKIENTDDVLKQWDQIKKEEKTDKTLRSVYADIPKDLPSLAYAARLIKRMQKSSLDTTVPDQLNKNGEDQIGNDLWELVKRANEKKVDPEQALRKVITLMKEFS